MFESGQSAPLESNLEYASAKQTSVEFGIKSDVNERLRVNATVFLTDYENLQYQCFEPPPGAPTQAGCFQTLNPVGLQEVSCCPCLFCTDPVTVLAVALRFKSIFVAALN